MPNADETVGGGSITRAGSAGQLRSTAPAISVVSHDSTRAISALDSAEPPPSRSGGAPTGVGTETRVGRRGARKLYLSLPIPPKPQGLGRPYPNGRVLPSSRTCWLGGVTSKLAPVIRRLRRRILYSGRNEPLHRELNRRDNPPDGSKVGLKAPARPVDGKRKPGRVHAWGPGYNCVAAKTPPSRSERSSQGDRERVGRGSLLPSSGVRRQGVVTETSSRRRRRRRAARRTRRRGRARTRRDTGRRT